MLALSTIVCATSGFFRKCWPRDLFSVGPRFLADVVVVAERLGRGGRFVIFGVFVMVVCLC